MTYIIGHQKPDTDAVVAAMALAEFYKEAKIIEGEVEAVIADPLNPETTFIFEKFGIETPRLITASDISADDKVILVDHNEESQRLAGINPDQIVEVVDHHKVNVNFNSPISFLILPWGSTCSVIHMIMKTHNITPTKTTATLMLTAVLSDTVGYKSATCTDGDKKAGEELAKIAEIDDVETLTLEIFKAKSDVSKLSSEEIVRNDFKVFEFGKKTFIDQLETVQQTEVLDTMKDDLLTAMQTVKDAEGVELLFVVITDILQVNSKLLILGEAEKEAAEKAFGGQVVDNVLDIGPKMSRKKEIAPVIEKALQ